MKLEKNGFRKKSFLGALVVGHLFCSSSNSATEFNNEHENTCSFPCHIGSFIETFRDMCLYCNYTPKKMSVIFGKKFTINTYIEYIKISCKNL